MEVRQDEFVFPQEVVEGIASVSPYLYSMSEATEHDVLVAAVAGDVPVEGHPLHSDIFLCRTVPTFLSIVLRCKGDEKASEEVNLFLHHLMDMFIYYLRFGHSSDAVLSAILAMLKDMFDERRPFYSNVRRNQMAWQFLLTAAEVNKCCATMQSGVCAYVQEHRQPGDELIVYNVNYFGPRGFQVLLDSIQKAQLTSTLICETVDLFWVLHGVVTPSFRGTYVTRLRDIAFGFYLGLSEQMLRPLEKKEVEGVVERLEELETRRRRHLQSYTKPYEDFCLAFALKCFRCALLPKRLQGITHIDEAITAARTRKEHELYLVRQGGRDAQRSKRSAGITTQELATWINENRVLEDIYESDAHPELVKRSREMLVFLAREHMLSTRLMDVIWTKGISYRPLSILTVFVARWTIFLTFANEIYLRSAVLVHSAIV